MALMQTLCSKLPLFVFVLPVLLHSEVENKTHNNNNNNNWALIK